MSRVGVVEIEMLVLIDLRRSTHEKHEAKLVLDVSSLWAKIDFEGRKIG